MLPSQNLGDFVNAGCGNRSLRLVTEARGWHVPCVNRNCLCFGFCHRWLGYLGLLLFHVLICLLVLFGLIRNSKTILVG